MDANYGTTDGIANAIGTPLSNVQFDDVPQVIFLELFLL